jgi:hypothetical protein
MLINPKSGLIYAKGSIGVQKTFQSRTRTRGLASSVGLIFQSHTKLPDEQ